MDISTVLSANLKDMIRVLDLPELDVEQSLVALRLEVALAVPSFVGLSLIVMVGGQPVTLTSWDVELAGPAAATSLRLPVDATSAQEPGSRLVLYASIPGAFSDLAADLRFPLGGRSHDVRVDQDLDPATTRSGMTGVVELSMTNRAIGLLIGRGLTLEEAWVQLRGDADRQHVQVFQIAALMISMTE